MAAIAELEGDVDRLRAAIAALDGAGTAAPAGRGRSRAVTPVPAAAVVPAGTIARLLAGSADLTTAELAQRTGGAAPQILSRLKELEQAGEAHRTGNRRSTRWHAGASAPGDDVPSGRDGDAAPAGEPALS